MRKSSATREAEKNELEPKLRGPERFAIDVWDVLQGQNVKYEIFTS